MTDFSLCCPNLEYAPDMSKKNHQLSHCSPVMDVPVLRQPLAWIRLPAPAPRVLWTAAQSRGGCKPASGFRKLGGEL